MTTPSNTVGYIETEQKESWLPMVVIGMGQVQMSLNINALPVSIGNIVDEFNTAPNDCGYSYRGLFPVGGGVCHAGGVSWAKNLAR